MTNTARANFTSRAAAAFTLLELILVLVIVATLLSVSAASLRGLHASQTVRAEAEHFMRLCQQARNRAINEARSYRVTVDLEERTYWLSREGEDGYELMESEIGRRFELDERFTLASEGVPLDGNMVHLNFYPDGRSQPFRVTFATVSERVDVVRSGVSERTRIE